MVRQIIDDATEKALVRELKHHAKALEIPTGAATAFIEETLKAVKKGLRGKSIVTEQDLKRAIVRELKKYNADFAYVYENYDIIV